MKQQLAALGVTLAVALVGLPASADDKPKPPKATSRPLAAQPLRTSAETYRLLLQAYVAAVEARRHAVDEINRRFTEAVKTAQQEFKQARVAATSAEAKTTADNARKLAIAAATAARQAALSQLTPLPEPPRKPKSSKQ